MSSVSVLPININVQIVWNPSEYKFVNFIQVINTNNYFKSCSLACYKTHKESPCERPPVKESDLIVEDKAPQKIILFPTDDTAPLDKLEELRSSEGLKKLLENPHLRDLLKEIDSAENAWKAMTVAMKEPLFTEFADECLKIVEPEPL